MRETCGTAAEFFGCYALPDELESGGPKFEGSFFNLFGPAPKGSEEKFIYRPLA